MGQHYEKLTTNVTELKKCRKLTFDLCTYILILFFFHLVSFYFLKFVKDFLRDEKFQENVKNINSVYLIVNLKVLKRSPFSHLHLKR